MCQENEEEPRRAAKQFLKGGLLGHEIGTPVALLGPVTSGVSNMELLQLLTAPLSPPVADICTGPVLCSESAILLFKKNFWIPGQIEQC